MCQQVPLEGFACNPMVHLAIKKRSCQIFMTLELQQKVIRPSMWWWHHFILMIPIIYNIISSIIFIFTNHCFIQPDVFPTFSNLWVFGFSHRMKTVYSLALTRSQRRLNHTFLDPLHLQILVSIETRKSWAKTFFIPLYKAKV